MFNFTKLKKRIKRNEGYSNKVYFDQLGFSTIGYGHLIKHRDFFLPQKKYSKKYLDELFEKDFKRAFLDFKKLYSNKNISNQVQEVLIEMIFQLGINNFKKFKKFNTFINKNFFYLAALEMMDSLWYAQTPDRVDGLIKILLGNNND